MDKLIDYAFTLAICITAAAGAALALGMLHVPLPFLTRWSGSLVMISSARLAALTLGNRS